MSLNARRIRNGFAWRYVKFDKVGKYTAADNDARKFKMG